MLGGCGPEMERCVDQQNRVVDPKFCQNLPPATAQQGPAHGGSIIPIILPYRYYYGGGGGYGIGSLVSGGGYAPAPGHSYSLTKGTVRGGFGKLFSGGGSAGGGEGE
jgi:hypothetical protein